MRQRFYGYERELLVRDGNGLALNVAKVLQPLVEWLQSSVRETQHKHAEARYLPR